ncbi:MAG: hydrolase [Pseudomonadota bacterium]
MEDGTSLTSTTLPTSDKPCAPEAVPTLAPEYRLALDFLTGKRDEMTATLLDWCAQNSGSPNLQGLAAMHAKLIEAFSVLNARVESMPAGTQEIVTREGEIVSRPLGDLVHVVARPEAPIRVLLTGHMDTVFPADHPFQEATFLSDDVLNAPGAADMKGGLLVMLYALRALDASPFAKGIGYEVLINADEEIGSHGSAPQMVEAAGRADFACIYEPAMVDGSLAGARKGSGNFSVIIKGKAAHAGREHHLGVNAIDAAAQFITRISPLTGGRTGLTVNVARLDGGGPNNVVPDRAVVRFNVRVAEADDARWFMGQMETILAEMNRSENLSLEAHGSFYRPPKPMDAQTEAFFKAVRAVGAHLGLTIKWVPTGGCCDGNNIATAGIPVVDTLGVRGGKIHSADEFVQLDSLEERAKLSALLLMKVAAGDIPTPGRALAGSSSITKEDHEGKRR